MQRSLTMLLQALLFLIAGLTVVANGQSPALTSSTYTLGNSTYWVSPTPVSQLSLANSSDAAALQNHSGLVPFTVIFANGSSYSDSDLSSTIASYQASDDVWNTSFMSGKPYARIEFLPPNFIHRQGFTSTRRALLPFRTALP